MARNWMIRCDLSIALSISEWRAGPDSHAVTGAPRDQMSLLFAGGMSRAAAKVRGITPRWSFPPAALTRPEGSFVDELRILFIGDVVGTPGREILQRELPGLRERFSPHRIVVNAENARNGSGLSTDIASKLLALGADALTLGDHAYRDRRIVPLLEDPSTPVLRPANLAAAAPGKFLIRLPASPECPRDLWIFTVLGRVGMNLPADDPFACADRILAEIPEREPVVLVEAHMEATSEKAALGFHLDGRVSAVLGTHTHVPTADARILRQGTGFISDVGMTGPYDSVIGRDAAAVLRHMTTGVHVPYEVGRGREAVGGCLVAVDPSSRRCRRIEPFVVPAFHRGGA